VNQEQLIQYAKSRDKRLQEEAKSKFDAKFYATTHADVKQHLGMSADAMWKHYMTHGIKEGRKVFFRNQ
jgi:hypothetical protein